MKRMNWTDVTIDGHEESEWVEAEIAQELYDMLVYVLSEMDHNPILETDIRDVLTKVNEEG